MHSDRGWGRSRGSSIARRQLTLPRGTEVQRGGFGVSLGCWVTLGTLLAAWRWVQASALCAAHTPGRRWEKSDSPTGPQGEGTLGSPENGYTMSPRLWGGCSHRVSASSSHFTPVLPPGERRPALRAHPEPKAGGYLRQEQTPVLQAHELGGLAFPARVNLWTVLQCQTLRRGRDWRCVTAARPFVCSWHAANLRF